MAKNKIKKWDATREKEYQREYYLKNKDKLSAYHKKWHAENKEHVAQYIEDNKEKIAETSKAYRETHKAERKENWNKWYKKHPERSPRRRFTESKNKAVKKRKLTWTLTFEEYKNLIELPCYYCNYELGTPVIRSCGLDRLDSNKGYKLNNVVSCCQTCNTIKGAILTPEETKIAVQAILAFRKNKLST